MSILNKIFGDANEKYLKSVGPTVEKLNSLEPEFEKFSDEKLKEKTVITTTKTKAAPKVTTTIIAKCDCVNEYQDKTYGKGMRAKNSKGTGFKCTVCGKV